MPSIDPTSCEKYCILRRGSSWFGLPAYMVREITLAENMVPVPGTPKVLVGLCHMRSEFVPVVRLPSLSAEERASAAPAGQLLVLTGAQGPWGLAVDEVETLEPLEVSVSTDPRGADSWSAAVMGSASYRGHVVHVLDPNAFYQAVENALKEDAAGRVC
jgi:chemotaxis signal transduction protein